MNMQSCQAFFFWVLITIFVYNFRPPVFDLHLAVREELARIKANKSEHSITGDSVSIEADFFDSKDISRKEATATDNQDE